MLFQTVDKISKAIRKIAEAASDNLGKDCIWHAVACKELLRFEAIESEVKIGVAAWRVGDADGAVILHLPMQNKPIASGTFPYHCWVEISHQDRPYIIDTTVYQFKQKMSELDKMDGQKTEVMWNPKFLFVLKEQVSKFEDVVQNDSGDFFYQEVPEFLPILPTSFDDYKDDFNLLKLTYMHPEWKIIGPNDIKVI